MSTIACPQCGRKFDPSTGFDGRSRCYYGRKWCSPACKVAAKAGRFQAMLARDADRAEVVHRCGAPTKSGTPCGNAVVAPDSVCHHHCPECAHIPYDKRPGVGWRARQAAHEAHQPVRR